MVVDADGQMVTQREHSRLARVRTALVADSAGVARRVRLMADDMPDLDLCPPQGTVSRGPPGDTDDAAQEIGDTTQGIGDTTRGISEAAQEGLPRQVTLHGRAVQVRSCTPAADAWFTQVLKRPVQLVCQHPEDLRWVAPGYAAAILAQTLAIQAVQGMGVDRPVTDPASAAAPLVSLADGFPYLLANQATLQALADRGVDVPMNRFRPNLVVAGAAADAEYAWREIGIGGTRFALVKPCERCVVTTIDQERGERTGKEPLTALARSHFLSMDTPDGDRIQGAIFGENALVVQTGTLLVGAPLTICATGSARPFRTPG